MLRYPLSVRTASVLLSVSCLMAACGARAYKFDLPQRQVNGPTVYPWRVAAIADKQFTPYKIRVKYWSAPIPSTLPFEGLPDAFVNTLRPHFPLVEQRQPGQSIRNEQFDLVARMSVDQLHFDGANTTVGDDKVDLAMTFTLEQLNGTKVFERTVTASASSPYRQDCAFCRVNPSEVFAKVFREAFVKLAETLEGPEILALQKR
jgi:hypothetical protein